MLGLLLNFVIGLPLLAEESIAPAATATTTASTSLLEMQDKIAQKKKEIDDLKNQSKVYEETIKIKQTEAVNLKNQIAILDNRIAKVQIDIKTTKIEIEETALQIESAESTIETQGEKIKTQKEVLANLIRSIYRNDAKNKLEVFILNDSFSQFFNQINYLEDVGKELQKNLNQVQVLKEQLETQKKEMDQNKAELETFKQELENRKFALNEQIDAKSNLLAETKNSEQKFKKLLTQLKQEQEAVNTDITDLEKAVREKLEPGKIGSIDAGLLWPVNPSRGLTALFHDPDYPFNYIFPHPAVDIRASQSTPVRATANGYVARAKNAGYGYNYIMLVHDKGLSSVYGHVSKLLVAEDTYVKQGDIIALSGGLPGTRGAGRLTTGAHLHFELRLNGVAVNPLDYLP